MSAFRHAMGCPHLRIVRSARMTSSRPAKSGKLCSENKWFILFILLFSSGGRMGKSSVSKKHAGQKSGNAADKAEVASEQAAAGDGIVVMPVAADGDDEAANGKKSAKAKNDDAPTSDAKVKKAKLVRDSFTMPEAEYKLLGEVKRDCLKAGIEVKKSELLRAGVALIRQMDIEQLKAVLAALPALKAGRPKKEK
ncbi:hypothetical protein [Noviherbaspirillum cavernae]|uniref:hypothetical protein n=1 Tax=Noviherbaspirillum cavernae TaxID=2320862 RepID=UPI0018F5F29E|nr:hypothetical protein [Noviherbaspirillum cavernae]